MSSKREITIAGEKIWLRAITGTVAGEKKWSESRTSGGTVNAYGHTAIRTTVNTRHEFWLIAPDGEEQCLKLGDSKVAVRENQVLTAIWGARDGAASGPFLLIRNHNASAEDWLIQDETRVLKAMSAGNPMVRWGLGGIGAGLVVLFATHFHAYIFALALMIGCAVYGKVQRSAKVRGIRQAAAASVELELSTGRGIVTQSLDSGGQLLKS